MKIEGFMETAKQAIRKIAKWLSRTLITVASIILAIEAILSAVDFLLL